MRMAYDRDGLQSISSFGYPIFSTQRRPGVWILVEPYKLPIRDAVRVHWAFLLLSVRFRLFDI